MSAYASKWKNPKWQKVRLLVLERDGWRCRQCGDAETCLQVHHTFYASGRDPWEYPLDSLVTLCERCHAEVESAVRATRRSPIDSQKASKRRLPWFKFCLEDWGPAPAPEHLLEFLNLLAHAALHDGYLPDDDAALAKISRSGDRWPQCRDAALRGFVPSQERPGCLVNPTLRNLSLSSARLVKSARTARR